MKILSRLKQVFFGSLSFLFLMNNILAVSVQQQNIKYEMQNPQLVVVIPSYNNKAWFSRNLDSIKAQTYPHFRVIYIDDASTDGTAQLVQEYIESNKLQNKITLIRNNERKLKLANMYQIIHSLNPQEVVIEVDGDDWLSHPGVLSYIAAVYQDKNVWMTYGQFTHHPTNNVSSYRAIPNDVIERNTFRQYVWHTSHLKTYYAWLFQLIAKEDLMYNNAFFTSTADQAYMFPMLEMAGFHSRFIPQVLYVYNIETELNDNKVDAELQRLCEYRIRQGRKYNRLAAQPELNRSNYKKTISNETVYKIGFCVMATGKYTRFVKPLIDSARNILLPGHDVKFYIFTDGQIEENAQTIKVFQKRLGWPYDTMMRFEAYYNNKAVFADRDYMFAIDADMLFVRPIGTEILSDRVGTTHPGYANGNRGTYDTNPRSTAYVARNEGNVYFAGGLYGGTQAEFLRLLATNIKNIRTDLEKGYIALWHDESHLNRYFIDNVPTKTLPVEYCVPEELTSQYPPAKIYARYKSHQEKQEIR